MYMFAILQMENRDILDIYMDEFNTQNMFLCLQNIQIYMIYCKLEIFVVELQEGWT